MYSCTLSLTSAPDGVRGQHHGPAALILGPEIYSGNKYDVKIECNLMV